MKRSLKQIFSKCVKDEAYRAEMTLYLNLAINLCYAVFKAVCGIFFHSAWIGTLAFYYILLSIMRLSLAKGMSILMQKGKESISYPGYLIYGVAAYTFYAVVTVFSLQSAMLNTFGDDPGFARIMGIATGFGAFVIINFIAVRMIAKGYIKIKAAKDKE